MTPLNFKRPPHVKVVENYIDGSATWGEGTVIWWFARILQEVRIGRDCSIGGNVEVGRGSVIGDRTRIGAGTFLPPNSVIGKEVFIGPNVTFTDDKLPRIPQPGDPPYHAQPPIVEDNATIGAGAIILPGVTIRRGAMVAAGAIVTKDVAENGMVRGQPARPRTPPEQWLHAANA